MNVPDVNVWVALFRSEHPHHDAAVAWWEASLDRGEPFTVPDFVWVGFHRVVTNRRIFESPDALEAAAAFASAVTEEPTCLRYVAGPDTMQHFLRIANSARLAGSTISDAYIAACAMDYGATVVTFDRDFRKFDNLRVTELLG